MKQRTRCWVLSIFLIVIGNFSYGQTWEALNPPLNLFNGTIDATTVDASNRVYAAGEFKNSSSRNFVARWDGANWNELGTGAAALKANGAILSLASRGDTIFAAGFFTNQSFRSYVAKWDGTSWTELGQGLNALNANNGIYSIVADQAGNIYAAGTFTNAAGKSYVAKWNGTAWSELGSGANALNPNDAIFSIAVDKSGNVYAGGYFTNAAGKKYVAKWDGTTWSELGTGINALNANGDIRCLSMDDKGNLYAGGSFRNASNEYYVARWDGTTWTELGSGTAALHANSTISSIAINRTGEVYAAGFFTNPIGYYTVAKWNGTAWSEVSNPQGPLLANKPVQSLSIDANGHLYTGGKFVNKSGHSFVALWNGISWRELGGKGDPFYTTQTIFQVVGDSSGKLFVSGDFQDAGGRSYLQHWNGQSWQQLKVPDTAGFHLLLNNNQQMVIDRKGALYATGRTVSGNASYDCILKWDGARWRILEDFPNSIKTSSGSVINGINEVEIDQQGNIYAAGRFNDPTQGEYGLAKWDGTTWVRLGGSDAYIQNFCVAGDGTIYAYGDFTNETGRNVIVQYIPNSWPSWTELKSGTSRFSVPGMNVFMALATDSNHHLYVNGYFTNAAGKRYVAKWDKNSWSEFGPTSSLGLTLAIDQKNNVYSSQDVNSSAPDPIKKWNGSSWQSVGSPFAIGLFPTGYVLALDLVGNIYTSVPSGLTGVGEYIVKYAVSPPPKLTSFTPSSGSVGTVVTITGKHLGSAASVRFGGTNASSFRVINDSTLSATIGSGATGSVVVSTASGVDSLQAFTFTCDSVKGPVPQISIINDSTLVSSSANNYQWFFNNRQLNNQTSNSLRVTSSGFYHVETSADKVCWVSSLDFPLLISQNTLSDSLKLSLFPNPSSGQFTVQVQLPRTTTVRVHVQVFDVNGIQVSQTSNLVFFGNEIKIPLSIATKGTYFVKVVVNNVSIQQQIMIL
jgi:hypothetical protein